MAFTAQDFEKYMGRKVMVVTCLDQRIVGVPLEPVEGLYGGIVYFNTRTDSGTDFRKGVSATAIEGVWDMEALWNECPTCDAAPGNRCTNNTSVFQLAHADRFAGHQADALTAKRKQESADLARLAASRRTHTEDSVIAGYLPGSVG